ncbi:YlxR family protein [Quadrisphaera oryzae]|uniref:YlxR family protein n=1 Tax=Quadrisphaera TaxID=317661 RepID=UPI00351C1C0D
MGCRQRGDRSRLLRVVADRSGGPSVLLPDPGARLPGRGAWVHLALACLDLAERRRAFPRALRLPGPLDAGAVREHLQQRGGSPAPEHH